MRFEIVEAKLENGSLVLTLTFEKPQADLSEGEAMQMIRYLSALGSGRMEHDLNGILEGIKSQLHGILTPPYNRKESHA